MNELDLSDALVSRVKDIFYGEQFTSRKKDAIELHDVNVFAQYIPQAEGITEAPEVFEIATKNYNESDFEQNFPCVIVRITDRIDNEERSIVMSQLTAKLIVCVYDESSRNEGYRDVMNMLAMMREDFLENRFIAGRFRILMPMKSRMLESDTWPLTYGEIELKIETGRKAQPLDYIYRRKIEDVRRVEAGERRGQFIPIAGVWNSG